MLEHACREDANRDLHLRLCASPALVVIVTVIHLGAVGCVYASDLPSWVHAGLTLAVLVALTRALRRYGRLQGKEAVLGITLLTQAGGHPQNQGQSHDRGQGAMCHLAMGDRTLVRARVVSTQVTPLVVILVCEAEPGESTAFNRGSTKRCLVTADMVDSARFHRLRQWAVRASARLRESGE